jgi:hypothetical protein
MPVTVDQSAAPAAIRVELDAIFVSLELSKSTWLVTSLLPSITVAFLLSGGRVGRLPDALFAIGTTR